MLSNEIKRYRKSNKISKAELSRMTGLSTRSIEYLENGKMDNPTLKTLKILSKILEIDINKLVS